MDRAGNNKEKGSYVRLVWSVVARVDMSELEVTLPNGMLIDGEVGALLEAELPTPPFKPVPGTPMLAPPCALLPWDWLPPPPV